jgi:hypothetical protein
MIGVKMVGGDGMRSTEISSMFGLNGSSASSSVMSKSAAESVHRIGNFRYDRYVPSNYM